MGFLDRLLPWLLFSPGQEETEGPFKLFCLGPSLELGDGMHGEEIRSEADRASCPSRATGELLALEDNSVLAHKREGC